MLASGLWPVNTLSRRRVAGHPDEALQPAGPEHRYRCQPERHGGAGSRPLRALVRIRPRAAAVRSGGLPRPAVRPRSGRGRGRTRWILLGSSIEVDLAGHGPASHVVVAHLCDAWRDDAGRRPAGLAVGHVVPVGEPLARYTVVDRSGRATTRLIRRRFEVNEGILGWGSGAFAAIPHLENEVLDWRGPHAAQGPGRYAPPGQSGSLTIMPGTYGGNQVGMTDFVPSPGGDALLWLHAIRLEPEAEPVSLRLESLTDGRPGSDVILAAVTVYRGSANPLVRGPRMAVRIEGLGGRPPEIDLGSVIRTRPSDEARGGTSHGRDRRLGPAAGAGTDDAADAASSRRRGTAQRDRPVDRPGRHHQPRRLGRAGERAAGHGLAT